MVVVPVVFLFILLRGIILYVVMCIILSHALLSIVICDWIWIYYNRPKCYAYNLLSMVTLDLFRLLPQLLNSYARIPPVHSNIARVS